jgi:hypothetical protein
MPSDLLKFLFEESQRETEDENRLELDEDIMRLLEAAEDKEKLEIKAKPLVDALKEVLDLTDAELQVYPGGVKLRVDDQDRYNYFRQQLAHPEVVNKLAELGWVQGNLGDKNSLFEPPCWELKFLDINTALPTTAEVSKEIGDGKDQGKWDDYMRKAGEKGLGQRVPDIELKYGPNDLPDPKKPY